MMLRSIKTSGVPAAMALAALLTLDQGVTGWPVWLMGAAAGWCLVEALRPLAEERKEEEGPDEEDEDLEEEDEIKEEECEVCNRMRRDRDELITAWNEARDETERLRAEACKNQFPLMPGDRVSTPDGPGVVVRPYADGSGARVRVKGVWHEEGYDNSSLTRKETLCEMGEPKRCEGCVRERACIYALEARAREMKAHCQALQGAADKAREELDAARVELATLREVKASVPDETDEWREGDIAVMPDGTRGRIVTFCGANGRLAELAAIGLAAFGGGPAMRTCATEALRRP